VAGPLYKETTPAQGGRNCYEVGLQTYNITNGYGANKLNTISRALASSRGERSKRVEPAQTFEYSENIKFRTDEVMSPRQRRLQAPFRGP